MKKIILLLLLIPSFIFSSDIISKDCTFKGKFLTGRIRIVNVNEDIKVRIVDANEDIRIYIQPMTWTDRCAEWYFVTVNEDFKIRFVDANEDFRIRFVTANPGVQ